MYITFSTQFEKQGEGWELDTYTDQVAYLDLSAAPTTPSFTLLRLQI